MIPGMINLKPKQKIALDTNIFICALNQEDSRHKVCLKILEQVDQKGINAFVSAIVLEEFFVKIYKLNKQKEINYFLDFITMGGSVVVIDVNRDIALTAAKIRANYYIKVPDAIHLASAIEAGAKIFVTTDKKLPRKIGKLTIKVLG